MIERKCAYCGKVFYTRQSEINKGFGIYCCRKCSNDARSKKVEVTCDYCGKTKVIKQSEANRYTHHFCSKECEAKYRKGHPTRNKLLNEIELREDYAVIKIPYQNQIFDCIIDLEDVDRVSKYTWRLHVDKRTKTFAPYVVTHTHKNRVFIHRFITMYSDFDDVDHINGNKLDNRKSNLRIISHQQNTLNRKGVGVHFNKRDSNWIAGIRIEGKIYNLGYYRTEAEARERRKKADKLIEEGKFEELKNLKCVTLRNKEIRNKSGELYINIVNNKFQVRIRKLGFYFYKVFFNIEDAREYRDSCLQIMNKL